VPSTNGIAGDARVLGIGSVFGLLPIAGVQVRVGEDEGDGVHLAGERVQDPARRAAATGSELAPPLGGLEELAVAPDLHPPGDVHLDCHPARISIAPAAPDIRQIA